MLMFTVHQLVLYNCAFDGIEWNGNEANHARRIHDHWRTMWQTNDIRNALIDRFTASFQTTTVPDMGNKVVCVCVYVCVCVCVGRG